jgi:hypothetical protein
MGAMNELDAWVVAAAGELGLKPDDVQPSAVLEVARDVAHQVLRPGAPVTAYLMGIAVGRGADPADAAARISALAQAWPGRDERQPGRDEEQRGRDERQPDRDEKQAGRDDQQRGRVDKQTVADPPPP